MTNPNYNPLPNIPQVRYTNQSESIIGANVTVEASHRTVPRECHKNRKRRRLHDTIPNTST